MIRICIQELGICLSHPICFKGNDFIRSMLRRNRFLAYAGLEMYDEIRKEIMDEFQSFMVITEEDWEQTSKMVDQTVCSDLDQMELQVSDLAEYPGEQEESLLEIMVNMMDE